MSRPDPRTDAGAAVPAAIPAVSPDGGLARAIGRRCRGRTLVLGTASAALRERLAHERVDVEVRPPADAPAAHRRGESFDVVLVADSLEHLQPDAALALLQAGFALLAPRGQLLVCVPNGDLAAGAPQSFRRADLKQLLERIDQPKVYTDQPLAWLLMGIVRDAEPDHTVAERCRVIAALCRGRVIELGCGAGHLSAAIARRGLKVAGVDLSARKIARARARYPGLEFREGDILEVPLDDVRETVVLAEVLEHVPAEVGERMLARAWSLVAPGGQLVVSVPNEDCVPHRNHVREFTLDGLRQWLSGLGATRVESAQPFKWLLMCVDKPPAAR